MCMQIDVPKDKLIFLNHTPESYPESYPRIIAPNHTPTQTSPAGLVILKSTQMLDATGICHMNRMDVLWIFRFASNRIFWMLSLLGHVREAKRMVAVMMDESCRPTCSLVV